jgi:outer membrane beta-barrel protein
MPPCGVPVACADEAPADTVTLAPEAVAPDTANVGSAGTEDVTSTTGTTAAPVPADGAAPPPAASAVPAPPRAVANPRITGTRKVRLVAEDHNVVRSGPGESFSIVGVFPRRTTFPVDAKTGDWYHVRLSDSESGWIHASLCEEFDDLSDLEWRPNPKLFTRTGSYILTGYAGAYAFDRKSNSLVLGGRLGYYVFDRVQAEGGVGWTRINRPAEIVESLFGLELEAEKFDMLFYHLLLTYELLPGRQMVPYVSGGVGSSIMQGESEPSFNIGAGTSLFLAKRTAVRWEFRHYVFRSGSADSRTSNRNIEFTLGTAVLF